MNDVTISKIFDSIYRLWPGSVDTSVKLALGTTSFRISGLWEIYEHVEDNLGSVLKSDREVQIAQVINWAIFKTISEIGKTEDLVTPIDIPREHLLIQLERCAREPTLQPEVDAIIGHVRELGQKASKNSGGTS